MPTAEKGLEDIRREVEETDRLLDSKQHQLKKILEGTKSASGERQVHPHEAEQIRQLEGDCLALTQKSNGLKMDFLQAKTEQDLDRRKGEVYRPAVIHPGLGGTPEETPATKGTYTDAGPPPASLGDAFIQSETYRKWMHGSQSQMAHTDVHALSMKSLLYQAGASAMKATLTSTGMTSIDKYPDVIALGQQPLSVADLMTQAQTNNTTIRYLQETSFTNTAATVAENAQKPEGTFALNEVDAPVRKIAWVARATNEMFEDYAQIRDYINQRLPFGVQQREEFQLLSGDGNAPNLQGILGVSGILTQAKGTDSNVDAFYKAITKVRTQGFWEPDAIVVDPANWNSIRLLKTTVGEYVYGDPWAPGPETIFGKRVVITVNMGLSAANTAIVGAWKLGGTVFYRHGIRVEATNSDGNDFQFNRVAIRAEQREAAAWWRPKAFCTVTGLDQ